MKCSKKKVKRFFASLSLLSRSLQRKNKAHLSDIIAAAFNNNEEKNVLITNDVNFNKKSIGLKSHWWQTGNAAFDSQQTNKADCSSSFWLNNYFHLIAHLASIINLRADMSSAFCLLENTENDRRINWRSFVACWVQVQDHWFPFIQCFHAYIIIEKGFK